MMQGMMQGAALALCPNPPRAPAPPIHPQPVPTTQLPAAAPSPCSAASNAALAQAGQERVQWQHSYVADGKTFCIYLAEDEAAIHEHAKIGG